MLWSGDILLHQSAFSEHYRQDDIYMQALRVITAGCLSSSAGMLLLNQRNPTDCAYSISNNMCIEVTIYISMN